MKSNRKLFHSKLRHNNVEIFSYVFLGIMCIIFLYPMFVTLVISISSEESIRMNGFRLIPDSFSLEAYRLLLKNYGSTLGRALLLTIGTGLIDPLLTIVFTMCMAYPLSQMDFKGGNFIRKLLLISMLFSGGLVPGYILRTRYLGLRDNILIYLIPEISAWSVFLFRTFFVSIDKSMVESARIDGASKFQILLKIMLPLTKPLVAMQYFNAFLNRWNDINTPLYYITDRKLYTVQYLLQEMLRSADQLKAMIEAGMSTSGMETINIPVESTRYAVAVIGALPVFIIFPYIQKYYAKGIMLGSTKG